MLLPSIRNIIFFITTLLLVSSTQVLATARDARAVKPTGNTNKSNWHTKWSPSDTVYIDADGRREGSGDDDKLQSDTVMEGSGAGTDDEDSFVSKFPQNTHTHDTIEEGSGVVLPEDLTTTTTTTTSTATTTTAYFIPETTRSRPQERYPDSESSPDDGDSMEGSGDEETSSRPIFVQPPYQPPERTTTRTTTTTTRRYEETPPSWYNPSEVKPEPEQPKAQPTDRPTPEVDNEGPKGSSEDAPPDDSIYDKEKRSKDDLWFKPGILAAVIGGAVVGLLAAILLVMFIIYRMRKKDEGSYALDEPKTQSYPYAYQKAPTKEFYA